MEENKKTSQIITLEPETEIMKCATKVAKISEGEMKEAYIVWYTTYAREFLISILNEMACEIQREIPENNQIYVCMCLEQLKSIKLPETLELIYPSTFDECINLKDIEDEITKNGELFKRRNVFRVMIKYIAPVLLFIILVFYSLVQFGFISY